MASLIKLNRFPIIFQRYALSNLHNMSRSISTSKKNSDTATTACEVTKEDKNWVSYGFHFTDKEEDTNVHNASFFFSVTICLVFGAFIWAYAPDVHMRDWAQREAFIELRRREKAGLPLIDPNYVSPKSVKLPSEEEITQVGIVI